MRNDLQTFVQLLKSVNQINVIEVEVNPLLEVAELTDRESKRDATGGKALLMPNNGTEFPILTNAFGSEQRMSMALGVDNLSDLERRIDGLFDLVRQPRKTTMFEKLKTLYSARKWIPKSKRGRGRCQEVVMEKVDLSRLPILQTWQYDGGRFITLPMVHSQDLESGNRNVGMYRMQVIDNQTTAMHWQMHKTGERHFEQYRRAGKRMPITVTLGGDPIYTYAATAPLPDGIDEYLLAGFLRQRPVKLVRCLTNDLKIPEDCDFVIEGYIDPTEAKIVEGPFGDHTGFYSLEDYFPLFHITCITHRRDAIYPTTLVGVPPMEDRYLAMASERIFASPIRQAIAPEIVSMTMPWQGVAHNLAIVEIQKSYPGQGFKVASALWGAGQMSFCKVIVATHPSQKWYDVENRSIFGELLITRGVADMLDHAAPTLGVGGKLAIDATSDNAQWWQVEVTYDPEVEQNLNPDEKLWLALGNIDPLRDITIDQTNSVVRIDATSKEGYPNVVVADDQTIEMVDSRWSEYGLGNWVESPSMRYKFMTKGNGATRTI